MTMNRERSIRTLLVEDEHLARERLHKALKDYDRIEIVGEAESGPEALEMIRNLKPELVFLDVQMPGISGIEVLQQIEVKPLVIFTTAYDEYAIKAFEMHAVDYLLKPYGRDRLRNAVDRALARHASGDVDAGGLNDMLERYNHDTGPLERICVRSHHTYKVIDLSTVDYFAAEGGLTFLFTGEEKYLVDASLSHLETQLDSHRFYRVHRNALVNLNHIRQVVPWGQGKLALHFSGEKRVFVSRHRMQDFKRRIGLRL